MSGDNRHNRRWVSERLLAYVDGELEAREAGFVAAHLEVCPDCRAAVEALTAQNGSLAAIFTAADAADGPAVGPGPDFAAGVMAEIGRREELVRASRGRVRPDGGDAPPPWMIWAKPLAAASMVATLLLGSYTALTLDARSYAKIIAYQQRAASQVRDNLWSVARRTGLDGILARYLSQLDQSGR
ncbi:MAG: zf-HC2 domain-containing protein [Bacillota bacterium]